MEKEFVGGAIGTVGGYSLAIKGSKLVLGVQAGIPVGQATLGVEVQLVEVLKLLKTEIPGTIDDAILDVAIAAIEKL